MGKGAGRGVENLDCCDNLKDMKLMPWHRHLLGELSTWHRDYIPPSGLSGRTVLDAGAGSGETARMFFNHGARRVICIEPDPRAAELIRENFPERRVVFVGDFDVLIVNRSIDFVKIDIEGREEDMVVESHFPSRWKRKYNLPFAMGTSIWTLKRTVGSSAIYRLHRLRIYVAHLIRRLLSPA